MLIIQIQNQNIFMSQIVGNLPLTELDFAYLHSKGKIVAVTGTNGKTTVSMLTNKILHSAGYETFLCGNIHETLKCEQIATLASTFSRFFSPFKDISFKLKTLFYTKNCNFFQKII